MDMENLALGILDAFGTTATPAEMVELQLPQPSFNLRNILYRGRSRLAPTSELGTFTVLVDDLEAQRDGETAPVRGYAEDNTTQSA